MLCKKQNIQKTEPILIRPLLISELGITLEVQQERKALKNEKRYIFKVASTASKAHRYLIDKI
ncbi:Uncharacterised protein [Serratia grimesii]|nr:Uncharacterised protein [Serratia grimesii]